MPNIDIDSIRALVSGREALALGEYLEATSNLPGPRGNLDVAAAVAQELCSVNPEWALDTIESWSAIGADMTGGNTPAVMLPFTAAQSAGGLWKKSTPEQRTRLDRLLRSAANDARWRVREGAAMGLQRIGFEDFAALIELVERWEVDASLLEHRAIVAGLAEPPLLTTGERAEFGMHHATIALEVLRATPMRERKSDQAGALRKALGYAFSVFIAANPATFPLLEQIARSSDKAVVWVVRENLKKARIAKQYPAQCAQIAAMLDD